MFICRKSRYSLKAISILLWKVLSTKQSIYFLDWTIFGIQNRKQWTKRGFFQLRTGYETHSNFSWMDIVNCLLYTQIYLNLTRLLFHSNVLSFSYLTKIVALEKWCKFIPQHQVLCVLPVFGQMHTYHRNESIALEMENGNTNQTHMDHLIKVQITLSRY